MFYPSYTVEIETQSQLVDKSLEWTNEMKWENHNKAHLQIFDLFIWQLQLFPHITMQLPQRLQH